jgi:AraC-like DNA-binding protein
MINSEQLHCGIYDSTLSRKYMTRTPVRETVRYELELYHNDKGVCFVDGEAYPVRRGMLLCARPGQKRSSQLPVRSSYIWVSPEAPEAELFRKLPQCIYIADPEAVEALLRRYTRLQQALSTPAPEPELTVGINGAFLELLHMCMRLSRGEAQRPMAGRLVREAYGYMDRHFSESCTLAQIAEHVHVTANHLHTVFLESEGMTPYDYVLQKRIERAKTLILMGEHSLAQIALETGFCSQSHFTAAFKKSTGQTPARYRKSLFDIPG